jgi:hypothetical protein
LKAGGRRIGDGRGSDIGGNSGRVCGRSRSDDKGSGRRRRSGGGDIDIVNVIEGVLVENERIQVEVGVNLLKKPLLLRYENCQKTEKRETIREETEEMKRKIRNR